MEQTVDGDHVAFVYSSAAVWCNKLWVKRVMEHHQNCRFGDFEEKIENECMV